MLGGPEQEARILAFRTAFPDLHFTIEALIAEGERVVFQCTLRGTHLGAFMGHAATGRSMVIGLIDIVRIVNGRFVEHWGGPDLLALHQQLGLPVPPAGRCDASGTSEALAAEDQFFQALLRGDRSSLGRVLAPDFLLIDVLSGSEIPRAVLLDLLGSRQLVFDSVERIDTRVRRYGEAAVVTGQTRMQGHYGEQRFEAHSRYTHVYVQAAGAWSLASAQGTPIAAAAV